MDSTGMELGNVNSRPPRSDTRIGSAGSIPAGSGPPFKTILVNPTRSMPAARRRGLRTAGESPNFSRHQ